MKHYSIDNKNKVITAAIARLTDKEMAEIQRYVAFGYTVEDGKPAEKVATKRLDNDFIMEYLKDDSEALEAYNNAKEALAVDEDGTIKTRKNKDGTVKQKKQGFNAGRNWFAKTYPKDIADLKLTAEQKEMIDAAYKKYSDKESDKEADKKPTVKKLTKDEYTKYYYWTKIFVQK